MSVFSGLTSWWSDLPSRHKRIVVFAGVALAVIGFISALAMSGGSDSDRRAARLAARNATKFGFKESNLAQETWNELGQRKLDQVGRDMADMRKQLDDLRGQQNQTAQQIQPKAAGQADVLKIIEDVERQIDSNATAAKRPDLSDLVPPSPASSAVPPAPVFPERGRATEQTAPTPTPTPAPRRPAMTILEFSSLNAPRSQANGPERATNATAPAKESASAEARFYIPTGTFVSGMLLTGLDAPTSAKGKGDPYPVLMRVQDLSFLPNEIRQNFSGCFALGEAFGDLSDERAKVRVLNLSCVDKDKRKVLDEAVKGYVADNDGKIGLRGNVVTKQGTFIGRALVASFIEGVASAFKTAQQTVVTTGSGVVTTSQPNNFSDGFQTGMAGGMSKAAEKLADFYMKMANDMFPVIEISARRPLTIVFTEKKEVAFSKQLITGGDDAE